MALNNEDYKRLDTAVPGAGAQGFMNHPDATGGSGLAGSFQAAQGNPGQSAGVDLSKPVAPGAFDANWVKGRLMATDEKLAKNKDTRDEKVLGMAQEQLGWQREDRTEKKDIQQNMGLAAQQGGYEGVIEYLKQVDPDRALAFEKQKLELDDSMAKSDTYQMAHSNDKLKVMVEGYSVLGNMGLSLLQAKPGEQENMYQGMLPLLKQVDPDMPDSLDSNAMGKISLAAAQASPDSLKLQARNQGITAESTTGKIDADIRSRIANGETVESSPGLKALVAQRDTVVSKATQAQQIANAVDYKQAQAQMATQKDAQALQSQTYQLQSKMQSDYRKDSQGFVNTQQSINSAYGALDTLKQDPDNGAAQMALTRSVGMAFNKGTFSDSDAAAFAGNDNQMLQFYRKLKGTVNDNGIVNLNPAEIGRLTDLLHGMETVARDKQLKWNQEYKTNAQKYLPQGTDLIYYHAAPKEAVDLLKSNPSPENQAYFKQTFGYDGVGD